MNTLKKLNRQIQETRVKTIKEQIARHNEDLRRLHNQIKTLQNKICNIEDTKQRRINYLFNLESSPEF